MKTDLHEWISQSDTVFDVLICKAAQLPDDFKILDAASIENEWLSAFHKRVGAFPVEKTHMALQHIAHRIAKRLAQPSAHQVDVSVNGLRNAWFHPVFSEITTLVPIRHIARKLAAQSATQPIAIELNSPKFSALNGWSRNDLEPLYLACELRRRNVPVVLFMEDERIDELQFKLSKTWLPNGYPQLRRDKPFTTVMCKRGIRQPAFVSQKSTAIRHHKPRFFSQERHFGMNRKPETLRLSLQPGPSFGEIRSLSSPSDTPTLEQGFYQLMNPLTRMVTQWYRTELKNHAVHSAHIADHASFEGGLLGAEVIRNGGKLFLWPHSANLVHMHVHDPQDVAQVTVAAQSTGAHWVKNFGHSQVAIDVRSILPDTSSAPKFDEDRPLNLVLFAGAHALRRMPLLDYNGHRASWTKLLNDLQGSDIELTIKHKSSWETREWIRRLAPAGMSLRFSRKHANKLALPNMLFLSVSFTSTALLEGIARGIPCITVRDVPVDETPYYDPDFVPCLPADKAVDFISKLNSKTAFEDLRERQRLWFERETSPNDTISALQ